VRVLAVTALVALSGCSTLAMMGDIARVTAPPSDTYFYAGKGYADKQEALAAAKASHDDLIAKTRAAAERIGGSLAFYIPQKPDIMRRGFESASPLSDDVKDYRAEATFLQYRSLYDAVVKRGSFDHVMLRHSNGGHVLPQRGERIVYLYLSGPEEGAWYFSSRDSSGAGRRQQLGFSRKPERSERVESWLERLDAQAKE